MARMMQAAAGIVQADNTKTGIGTCPSPRSQTNGFKEPQRGPAFREAHGAESLCADLNPFLILIGPG